VVDLFYEDCMESKGTRSIATQVLTLYGNNLKSAHPYQIHLANLLPGTGTSKAMDAILLGREQWVGFHTHREDPSLLGFPREKVVYLSPDSTEILTSMEPGWAYVVGGLVDRNRHPGASLARATALGVRTARLPIDEHAAVSRNDFLTISDVLWILSSFGENEGDWGEVFRQLKAKRSKKRLEGVSEEEAYRWKPLPGSAGKGEVVKEVVHEEGGELSKLLGDSPRDSCYYGEGGREPRAPGRGEGAGEGGGWAAYAGALACCEARQWRPI